MPKPKFRVKQQVRECKIVEVIRVQHTRGSGESEEDPVRLVTVWYTKEGIRIAEEDPLP